MKKIFSESIAAASAFCCICSLIPAFPANADSSLIDSGLNYIESTDFELYSCDSGYTSCPWICAGPGKDWSANVTKYSLLLIGIGGYSSAMNSDGTDYDLDEAFFTSLRNTLQSARSNGVTVGIRLRYDDNGTSNPEPADFSKVLRHIEQLGESGLLYEYEDVISFIETGLVGCWGEQWGGKYTSLEYKAQILDAFMQITPLSIPLTVRTPNTFRQWLKDYCGIETTAADMSYSIDNEELAAQAARVGLYNDGYMGSDSDLGTYSDRSGETAWLSSAPSYGGEFSGNDEWRLKYTTWQPEYALPEMYYTNLLRINSNIYKTRTVSSVYSTQEEAQSRLNEIDSLYEAAGLGDYDYGGVIEQTDDGYKASWKWIGYDDFIFDEELDRKLGVSCDNSAFYGESVWQFIRAHLGYRFVLRKSEISASADAGGRFTMSFSVENTGFSEAPKDKEVEVILRQGEITYTYLTDINAKEWESAVTINKTMELTLPKTMPGGEWEVYLRISDVNEDPDYDAVFCTRFANEDLQYDTKLGANLMGSFTVSGEEDIEKISADDTRLAGYYMNAEPIALDEETAVNLLDQNYTYAQDGHYGFTLLYKIEGIEEPVQLGNWYTAFTVSDTGYSSAYTTYGINTRNQELTADGYYAMHIPFYGCAFNCTEASVGGTTKLTALSINDSRNYWSEDTYTSLGSNTNVSITPLAFIEGGYSGYDVTYHLPDGDVNYTGTYGFEDKLSQNIQNITAVAALSLLDKECAEEYTDENGNVYTLLGFTTKKDDKLCIINENFIAMGKTELYPYYELDINKTDISSLTYKLVNGADPQGVRYVLDETALTATVGDGSKWQNNSGYPGTGTVIIPGYVESSGKLYRVTGILENAFYEGIEVLTKENTYELAVAVRLQKYLAGIQELTDDEKLKADIDKNGKVNIMDLAILKRKLHEKI